MVYIPTQFLSGALKAFETRNWVMMEAIETL